MAWRKARENETWNVKRVAWENCRYSTTKFSQSTVQLVDKSLCYCLFVAIVRFLMIANNFAFEEKNVPVGCSWGFMIIYTVELVTVNIK